MRWLLTNMDEQYFAVGLSVENKKAVVVGGGQLAEHRVRLLLDCRARVTVVSPDLTDHLGDLWREGKISWLGRRYQRDDLEGSFMVLATTNRPEINAEIYSDAHAAHALANIADDPAHCDFILPAVVRRGHIQFAITTSGRLPALSGWLRRKLDSILPRDLGDRLAELEPLRKPIAETWPSMEQRRKAWNEVLDKNMPPF